MSIPRMFLACSSASCAVLRDLDPARLAAAADLHLRLDDARIPDLVRRRDRLLDGGGGGAGGHRHPVAGEQLLALVLEKVHARRDFSTARVGSAAVTRSSPADSRAPSERSASPLPVRQRRPRGCLTGAAAFEQRLDQVQRQREDDRRVLLDPDLAQRLQVAQLERRRVAARSRRRPRRAAPRPGTRPRR